MSYSVQYLPADWSDEDMAQAQQDFRAFMNTKGYQWLGNYIGCRQRLQQDYMRPSSPGLGLHGMYIEGASRHEELEQFMGAFTYIDNWRPIEDGKKD